jgi:signal transduction histidine kinase
MPDDTDAIRLLIIEDSEDDSDLLVRELERGGYRLQYRRVDTPEGLQAALADRDWDLVIADYTMPRLSGTDALAIVRAQASKLPFIFVSGTIGEEAAVSALKSGAQDYIVKGKTGRLLPAIERELREARAHREREQLEARLNQAQKLEALGMLTGGIAHDFNNLLAVIIGNLDLITPRLKGDEVTHAGAKLALDAALRSAELTRQLLAFARQQPLSPKTFDLNQLVTGTVAMLGRVLGNQIEFRTDLSPTLWPTEADSPQVERALANLAINARDAMPDGGVLTIATRNQHLEGSGVGADAVVPGDYVALSVTDTGVGISPGELKRVLEPFYTTKAPGKGTGLGLSMVYGFAKQSRGHLELESALGRGTTVTIYLPRAESLPVAETLHEVTAAGPSREASVLVVEDNPHVQDVVVRQLSELGYAVHAVDDALAALRVLRQQLAIDLLFSDISLPGGISGTALAREAKKLRPGLKVLLTSGLAANAAGEDDLDRKGVEFIGKPYRKAELATKVHAVLRQAS